MKWSKRNNDHLIGIIFMFFGVIAYQQTYGFRELPALFFYERPGYFPKLVAIVLFVLGLYTFLVPFFIKNKIKDHAEGDSKTKKTKYNETRKISGLTLVFIFIIITIIYVRLFKPVGFILLTSIYLLIVFLWVGEWKWYKILLAGGISFFLYYIFYNFFYVSLP